MERCIETICKTIFPARASVLISVPAKNNLQEPVSRSRRSRQDENEKMHISYSHSESGVIRYLSAKTLDGYIKHHQYAHEHWIVSSSGRNTNYSYVQNRIIKHIHTVNLWSLTIGSLGEIYNINLNKYDGFIIFSVADTLGNDIQRNSILNRSHFKSKVFMIILGVILNLSSVFSFLEVMSFRDTVVTYQESNSGSLKVLSRTYNACGKYENSTVLESCRETARLRDTFKMFESPKEYRNCDISLIGFHDPPFCVVHEGKVIDGIGYKLLEIVASKLNLVTDVSPWKIRAEYIGIGVAETTDYNYIFSLDRYYTQKYTWFVPLASIHPRWSSLLRVFRSDVWVSLVFSIIIVSGFVNYSVLYRSKGGIDNLFNTWGVLLNIPVKWCCSNVKFRAVFLSWVIFSVAFTTVFQAFITSYFTDPVRERQIHTVQELDDSHLKMCVNYVKPEYAHAFLEIKSNICVFEDWISMFNLFFHKPNFGLFTTHETLLYAFKLHAFNATNKLFFYKFSEGFSISKSFYFPVSSRFRHKVDEVVRRLVEAGIVQKLVDTYIDPSGWVQGSMMEDNSSKEFTPLSCFHLFSSFIYLGVGFTISFVVFVCEIAFWKISPRTHARRIFNENT